jgi:peptide methionine sulfoxide reductase msrA/msrB
MKKSKAAPWVAALLSLFFFYFSAILVPDICAMTNTTNKPKTDTAWFAGGCFWGMEYLFRKLPGVISTRVGYMGGHKENPTYEEVCSGTTGHLETLEVVFDASRTTYETLAKIFFEIHDPTQVNGQGPDIGEQYLSAVFCRDERQKKTIEKLIAILREKELDVVTQIREADTFWPAEEYHQDYYTKTGGTPYCHIRVKRF